MSKKTLKKTDIVSKLLSGSPSKTVLLFDNSKDIRISSDAIGNELRRSEDFMSNKIHAFRVTNNMIKVKDSVVYFGLKKDEPMLLNNYTEQEIAYFSKEE